MKQLLFISGFFFLSVIAASQPAKKTKQDDKAPSQAELNKMMEEAMKGKSDAEKAKMREMMKGVTNQVIKQNETTADYPDFTNNNQLIPKRNAALINSVLKSKVTQADIGRYAATLFSKIMQKGEKGRTGHSK